MLWSWRQRDECRPSAAIFESRTACVERCWSWLNRHDWKSCVSFLDTEGSNPSLSAMKTVASRSGRSAHVHGWRVSQGRKDRMAQSIRITVGDIELDAELNDSETASRILAELPIRSNFNTWGDEIYFQISVTADPEDPRETVEAGDLAYWPPGKAFCIFWGPTPASQGDEIRPASPVNPVGRVLCGVEALKSASRADGISIEKSDA